MDDRSGRRRIAVVTEVDARNPRSLSGTPYSITRTLERHCGDVDCLGPAELPVKRVARGLNALARRTLKKQYDVMHNQLLARSYDVIFATYASTEIARLKTDIPIVYVTDLTFELALDSHPSFSNLPGQERSPAAKGVAEALPRLRPVFLPTRIEAFGISLIEACACGLPVISTDVGGVSELVREGEGGHTLPYDAGGRDYARLIADIFRDDVRYERLCRSARQEYEERLNWDAWGMAVHGVMENLLSSGKTEPLNHHKPDLSQYMRSRYHRPQQ